MTPPKRSRKSASPTRKEGKPLKAGVIGYGGAFNMGYQHLQEMQQAGMVPTAACDINPERVAVAEKDYPGIETYTSVAQMLRKSDVDVIAIITPHNTHAKLALQCLRAGRHVVCEKPMAITTAECDRMIAAAEKSGAVLSTYHNRHWDGCILQALKTIRSGAIGEVYRIEAHMGGRGAPRDWWRSSRTISGGILYDWGVHLLEYSLQIMDDELVEVSGYAHTGYWGPQSKFREDANEDEAFGVVRFARGGWLTLCMTSLDMNPKPGQVEVTGTEGTYLFHGREYELTQPKKGKTVVTKGRNPESEGWRFYRNLADHITSGEALVITAEWARRPIHVLDLMCRSAERGRSLKTKYA